MEIMAIRLKTISQIASDEQKYRLGIQSSYGLLSQPSHSRNDHINCYHDNLTLASIEPVAVNLYLHAYYSVSLI